MKTARLAGRQTSALGFGGSLLGSTSPEVARDLLRTAYDAGIRHFDVAPMYGFGRAESLLREALGQHLREVTLTTKYGLAPPRNSGWIAPVHQLARRLLMPFPALKRQLQRPASAADVNLPPLTATAARASVEESLRRLGVDTIDLLLLHEATPARLTDPDLLTELERLQVQGKIRSFGIGSEAERAEACLREQPAYCHLIQCEWNVFAQPPAALESVPGIRHGSLAGPRAALESWLLANERRCTQWSERIGADLCRPGAVTQLLFKAALEHSWPADRIVLFSTRNKHSILSNVATASDQTLAAPARALHHLVREEYLPAQTSR